MAAILQVRPAASNSVSSPHEKRHNLTRNCQGLKSLSPRRAEPLCEKSSPARRELWNGSHRFEHWYRDNTVYFITARCRDRIPAFADEQAAEIFWDRFDHYTKLHGFVPWVTSLIGNHYHTLGYLRVGSELGPMMRKLHGSVAKMVNDVLIERRVPFWTDLSEKDYFDGCIRDEVQCRRAYGYTLRQSVRHGICSDWRDYPHTHVSIELERGLKRAIELKTFLQNVPYKRHERGRDDPRV